MTALLRAAQLYPESSLTIQSENARGADLVPFRSGKGVLLARTRGVLDLGESKACHNGFAPWQRTKEDYGNNATCKITI